MGRGTGFALAATQAPPSEMGLFFYGLAAQDKPFGNGRLCVDAGGGLYRLPVAPIGPQGAARMRLDFDDPPANGGPGQITMGSTWYFQFWYRDAAGGGAGFNLSDGLKVTFCP
jgi:hypothetical protein